MFTNNTIIDSDGAGISGLFRNTPKANLPTGAIIKNNIFQSNIGNRGDLFIGTNFDNPSISKNVFFNIDAFGDNAIVADPKLKLIGDKPKPYFELGAGSPAIDAGEIIPGITDGYNGSLPDIGVYETESISAVLSGSDTLCLGQSANLYVDIANGVAPFTVVLNDGTSDTTITNYLSGFPIVITPPSTKTYTIASGGVAIKINSNY